MKSSQFSSPGADLEARFGQRVAAGLTEISAALPHDVSERLRFAREQALARVAQMRAAALVAETSPEPIIVMQGSPALAFSGGAAVGAGRSQGRGGKDGKGGNGGLWAMLASALPVLALAAGLLLMQRGQANEQIAAAAEVDTALLSDSLPPAAFSDPGFAEYLRDAED